MEDTTDVEIAEDIRQSDEYAKYIQSIGWKALQITNHKSQITIFIRNIFGLGIAKIQRTKGEIPWEKVFEILKKEKVFSLRWEPLDITPLPPLNLRGGANFKVSSWPLLGTKTLRVNLRPSVKNIFESFKKDCRYVLRRYQIPDNRCQINKFESFYDIWQKEAKRKRLWIPAFQEYKSLISCFGKKVFCVTYEDLGGAVILTHKKTAYYYYSACRPAGKDIQLPYLIIWGCMKEANKRGCTVWDFEGIYDERWPNEGWKGFSHFKKSFGGKEIEFPGSFQKWLWPW